jgi:phage I-like protein
MNSALTLAALNLELVPATGNSVPSEAHLLLPGPFRTEDGRPGDAPAWQLNESIACAVILRACKKQGDILIDYEHQSLRAEQNGQPAPAAGWFKALEWREGKGLYATGINWTGRAKHLIAAREYRYISAAFAYAPKSGEIVEIVSVALTNTPALDGLDALIAACDKFQQAQTQPLKEIQMPEESKEIAALTHERDGLKTEVAALKSENAALKQERDSATSELTKLKAKAEADKVEAEKAAHTAALKEAMDACVITPAERDALIAVPLAALTGILAAHPKAALLNKQADSKTASTAALSKEEAEVAAKFGLSHEQFLKAKG